MKGNNMRANDRTNSWKLTVGKKKNDFSFIYEVTNLFVESRSNLNKITNDYGQGRAAALACEE